MQNDTSFSAFIDDGADSYKLILVEPNGTFRTRHVYPKKDYKDFDHFVGIMGKFMPWWSFYEKSEPLADLKYDTIHDAFDRATARAAGHDFVISEGPITKAYGEER
jgi:hypothetical protein